MHTITVAVEDKASSLWPTDLAEFLFLFRAANVALSRLLPSGTHNDVREPTHDEVEDLRGRLGAFSPNELDRFFDPATSPDLLTIDRMTRESPMEIELVGLPLLLVLAVIFSGGEIQIAGVAVKAALPPLGTGIKALREALGLNKRLQANFGIRETTIKLNAEEYKELMIQPKGIGGFQSFIKGLQNRVNRQTKELTLSPDDLKRIYRNKADPKKGGWQARFSKIFGRHFPDDHSGRV